MTSQSLAAHIDHTLLHPTARAIDIERLCDEAIQYGCHSVCVPSSRIDLALSCTEESQVRVGTVIGFPLGHCDADSKRYETEMAIDLGAHEIDAMIHLGFVKDGLDDRIFRELRDIVEAAEDRLVKVIFEMSYLNIDEIKRLITIFKKTGAHFVKTSTGFGPKGVSVEDVRILREWLEPQFGIKAAGGIGDFQTAMALIEAGANRLGTSSTLRILEDLKKDRESFN